ncbi:exodeoxyribonuclease V subunit beta [Neiella sp. HB171785]|uniref:RecBCD enzyme subunit RecB n=1 Tax=Neiella litorisoli TaxID=2771431 RepID=A0A8J6QQC3_9GAMM|nr:exodeoxyribonuclease V subunit beta [Neiella litorisoli]MBD1388624.1 exodeoxyribonuclease V subunit beta [Neiella litorisoli]
MTDHLQVAKPDAASAPLLAQDLPLFGRHLIEASAGTGKTYNITRLYLRLLLERELPVQQILVMTFTRAATEELRGRIAETLRATLSQWQQLAKQDPFFSALAQRCDGDKARSLLQAALLEMDEAAIYTIHGFCNRVLSQQAFESALPFEVTMEADVSQLQQQAVQDWLRQISRQQSDYAVLAQHGWHQPEQFIQAFGRELAGDHQLINGFAAYLSDDSIALLTAEYQQQQAAMLTLLAQQQQQILSDLLEPHAPLASSWPDLLAGIAGEAKHYPVKLATAFATFNKYRAKAAAVKPVLQQLKQLTSLAKELVTSQQRQQQARAYQLVIDGIHDIRQAMAAAKQRLALLDYDDLIHRLHNSLASAPDGALSQQLQQQYPVALVDEFQDTDAAQYRIFDVLYPAARDDALLLMIGDPKQAIYGFRGGDIFTYLQARQAANYRWHMDTNWRSVSAMVTSYNRLFWGADLAESAADVFGFGIHYEQIGSTPHAAACKRPLRDPQRDAAMQYVWLAEDDAPAAGADGFHLGLAAWCANEAKRLLAQAQLGGEAIQPQDIALLVRSGREATFVRQALADVGLDAVFVSNRERLFDSPEATELCHALQGIWHCHNNRQLIRALASPLLAFDAQDLINFQQVEFESEFEQARTLVLELRQTWQQKGIMALMLRLLQDHFQPSSSRHERATTNMLHLAEILQQRSRQYKQPQQLLNWLQRQLTLDSAEDDYLLRLESDNALIRIVTQHGSKGLEYPIVFVPFAAKYQDPAKFGSRYIEVYRYQDPESNAAVCQLGQSDLALKQVRLEGHAEAMRLLYVAVTRAEHRCYLGVAPFKDSHKSALGQALAMPNKGDWPSEISQLTAVDSNHSAIISAADSLDLAMSAPQPTAPQQLQAASFKGTIADDWRLTSFSALTRNAHQVRLDQKEHSDPQSELALDAGHDEAPSELRFTLKKGAAAGNLLHDILEHVDFSDANWHAALNGPVQRFGQLEPEQCEDLIDWLEAVLKTPLPDLYDSQRSFCLAQLPWSATLRESEFYFPIASLQKRQLAKLLGQHRAQKEAVILPGDEQLSGMMHGFIDLIFEYQGRYYVADYKSTHMGNRLADYQWQALNLNNQSHYYDLQYLLYSLALHRYLQVRLADYQPEQHLGGVYYFYLRGMSDQHNEEEANYPGVYHRRLDIDLLLALDDLFAEAAEVVQ